MRNATYCTNIFSVIRKKKDMADDSDSGLTTLEIAGIAIACVVFVVVVVIIAWRYNKKGGKRQSAAYDMDPYEGLNSE